MTADLFSESASDDPKPGKEAGKDLIKRVEAIRDQAQSRKKPPSLLPEKHQQKDFFVADLMDYAFKDDSATMDAPLFSLSMKTDKEIFTWQSADGSRFVEVAPSAFGRATMFDKDMLIFLASQITEARNQGMDVARTVRFTAHDFLVTTNRDTSKNGYKGMKDALTRLRGTTIRTNIKTGGKETTSIFGLIESAEIITDDRNGRMESVEVTISQWLWQALEAYEVLTIDPAYFRLSKPMERRLYEIARKHVGQQGLWEIGLDTLWKKTGSLSELKKFKHQLKQIIADDLVPQYRIALQDEDKVTFYDRQQDKVAKAMLTKLSKRNPAGRPSQQSTTADHAQSDNEEQEKR